MRVADDYCMRKKLIIFGLTLLILASSPLLLRVLDTGLYNRFLNGVLNSESQIPIVMVLLKMGLLGLSSMGIMMGIIITVIGAVSLPLNKEHEPVSQTDQLAITNRIMKGYDLKCSADKEE